MTVDPKKWNIEESQDKDFKIAITNMLKIIKEDIKEYYNATCKTETNGNRKRRKLSETWK